MTEIHNSSDISITCGQCGSMFNGEGGYSNQVAEMYVEHFKALHEETVTTDIERVLGVGL